MCGIAGIIGVKENKQTLESMIHSIKHRGPDDSGIFSEAGIGLGHRRLSIIDLSKSGRNPMFNSDGSLVIVYNGEVFNYLEIKNEIGSRYNFQTDTDTEVVLAAYQIWGKECLQKFIGMYSFSIWNKKKRKLFAARDRLGIKPFYYYKNKKKFIFASEIKSLLCNDIPREPNNKVVFQYLFQGLYDHSEETRMVN